MMTDTSDPSVPQWLAAAWGFAPPARRGPKPAHSVQQIVQAAVELADAEGFAALSLPRTAQRLGLTANALYRYIGSKDELLMLVRDAGWGPPPATLFGHRHWRDSATAWVRGALDGYRAHPWLLDIPASGAPVTPNTLRWLEVLLEAMTGTGLTDQETLGCTMLLDGYARSTALVAHELRTGSTQPAQTPEVTSFLQPVLRQRGYRRLSALIAGGQYLGGAGDLPETRIRFGLERILDGIQMLVTDREQDATAAPHLEG